MRNHQPRYEIHVGHGGSYWVLRVVNDRAQIIERFEEREEAESFIACLNHIQTAPRRLALQ